MPEQTNQFVVAWTDGKREPICIPDLRFPDGIDLDITTENEPGCVASLPYPAKRCGHYYVECRKCGVNAVVTTAGRIDDPRSIKLPCKKK